MTPTPEPLGVRIRNKREALRMTQWALARELGTDQSSVSLWENGYRDPRPEQLDELARVLDMPRSELAAA